MTIDTDQIAQVASILDAEGKRHHATIVHQAADDIERLSALLTEARKWMVAPCGAAETSDLLFRIDAALDGGEEA